MILGHVESVMGSNGVASVTHVNGTADQLFVVVPVSFNLIIREGV
jgi:hypothetical protein